MRRWRFAKGHGTQNDFVLLPDRESMLHVGVPEVRYLCDRHAGLGGDGLLKVVRARHIPEWDGDPDLWFMDYRNADGSIAEMCGNGVRVFARYLLDEGLATGPVVMIATRSGLKEATALPDGRIRVAIGPAKLLGGDLGITTADGRDYPAIGVAVGTPHLVSFTDDLAGLPLHLAPTWTPKDSFPHGVNMEFVTPVGARHLQMRVYERGVGETRSCGTGTVAAVAAARQHLGDEADGGSVTYRVEVPGGAVDVELAADQTYLTGPAVIVANGHVALPEQL